MAIIVLYIDETQVRDRLRSAYDFDDSSISVSAKVLKFSIQLIEIVTFIKQMKAIRNLY